jgi:carbamoyltransferase
MKKTVLGLNTVGFNTSASLIINNKLVSAVEEERLSREKRTRRFPLKAINFCLKQAKLKYEDLSAIAISWNPAINLEHFNPSMSQHSGYFPSMLHSNLNYIIKELGSENLNKDYFQQKLILKKNKKIDIYFVNHHLSHASNYFLSPFKNASILTLDGFGENECMSFYSGNGSKLKKILSQNFPHSLGSFFSTFTEFCGFKPQSEEWKLMGASAYGQNSKYYKLIRSLVYLESGGFSLNLKYFNHYLFHRPRFYNQTMTDYLGIKPNTNSDKLTKNFYDIAFAAQKVFEEIYLHLINLLYKKNNSQNLVISGGCALNCVANGKVLSNTKFKKLYVPSVPDDSGASTGAAHYISNIVLKNKKRHTMINNYLGPSFTNSNVVNKLNQLGIKYKISKNISYEAAKTISQKKIIAWFQGALEFGDRALGNRSILADPRDFKMKDKINKKIKFRENFRPFAPAILEEYTKDFFEVEETSFFMEKALKIKKNKRYLIPSVTHVDGSGRLQTVSKNTNYKFYSLIKEFYKITAVPLVLNTSFNVQGEPIVCSIEDAIKNFYLSGIDELYIENCIIKK